MYTFLLRKLQKVGFAAKKEVISHLILDANDYRSTVFLAGTSRSGTTWVSNLINYDHSYRYLFEPFNPKYTAAVSHFKYRQYLPASVEDARYLEPARSVLSGKVKNKWIDQHNWKLIAKRRLVKDIRANFLLKWIKTHFPEIPIILLLRHPCAVASSRNKLEWEPVLDVLLEQEQLVQDHLEPFVEEMRQAESTFEQQIYMWCAENYVPLRQFRSGGLHLAFYENFCISPRRELQRLFSFLNRSYDPRLLNVLKSPSKTSRGESAIRTEESLVANWQKQVSRSDTERAVAILSRFGLDKIYADSPLPRETTNPFAARQT